MAQTIPKIDLDAFERLLSNLEFKHPLLNIERIKQNYIQQIAANLVLIKLKASKDIGLGHLSRMLTLGLFLKNAGVFVVYAINDCKFALDKLKKEGFSVDINKFSTDEEFLDFLIYKHQPQTIVVDEKYQYSANDIYRWKKSAKFVSIDFIGDGYEICDKIIMPNAHFLPQKYTHFNNIVWGWDWVLINKEILALKPKLTFPKKIEKVVITTGGSDPSGMLFKFLELLGQTKKEVLILIGDAFKHKQKLNDLRLQANFKILPYHPSKLLEADVALATFGVTVYELIYLNIPVICAGHTKENQEGCKVISSHCKLIYAVEL